MSNQSQDIVYEGWLTKSPPMNRIWKARWRRRWFVLKHSGELPMQYFLKYYTGKDCRKLKGTINLDVCDQVDAGLRFENSKQNYPHMFDIKTPKRTYYLAADSETEMNKWVDCVCQVCFLKSSADDSIEVIEDTSGVMDNPPARRRRSMSRKLETIPDRSCDYYNDITRNQPFPDSPPVSPTSSVSGPYIPISECVSGKPLNTPKGISDFNNIVSRQELNKRNAKDFFSPPQQSYIPTMPRLQTICADDISKSDGNKPIALPMPAPPPKPPVVERKNSLYEDRKDKITNIESAKKMAERQKEAVSDEFYDRPRNVVANKVLPTIQDAPMPTPNWETFPEPDFSPGDIGSWSVVNQGGVLKTVDSKAPCVTNSLNRVPRQRNELDTYSLRRQVAPPRPPKPQHFVIPELSSSHESEPSPSPSGSGMVQDETYDVPRSHQPNEEPVVQLRHNYDNATPNVQGTVFNYVIDESVRLSSTGETISPRFEGALQYSNLPSPRVTPGVDTPPAVNRDLKPARKMSDSGASSEPSPGPCTPSLGPISNSSAEPSPLGYRPPSIDRTLKPKKSLHDGAFPLAWPPEGSRRVRAAPSPTPHSGSRDSSSRYQHHDQYNFDRNSGYQQMPDIQYLVLDHDENASAAPPSLPPLDPKITSATPYCTIDVERTEAFNRTREQVEEKRKEWSGTN